MPRNSEQECFAQKKPQARPPKGAGVHDLLGDQFRIELGADYPEWLQINPYGTAEPGKVFLMRVWGWGKGWVMNREVFNPTLLAQAKVKLGDVSAEAIGSKTFMAGNITLSESSQQLGAATAFNGDRDTPAHLVVNTLDHRWIEFDWARNGAPPASNVNAFLKPVRCH